MVAADAEARRGGVALRVLALTVGVAALVLGLVPPIESYVGRLFLMHMVQHLLIGDVAPLLVVAGAGTARLPSLRRPATALVLWAVNLGFWHLPFAYDATLRHEALHALAHALFFVCGALLWAAILERSRYGAGARVLYLVGMWLYALALSQVFLWSGSAFYAPYRDGPRTWGLSAVADQRIGGGVMLVEGSVVMLSALVWLLLRLWAETEERQRVLDAAV